MNQTEFRREVSLKLKNAIYDEFGVYKLPIEANKLKSSDLYDLFENYEEIYEIIDEEYDNLRKFPIAILDLHVVRIENELLKIKEEMIEKGELERKIRRKQFDGWGTRSNNNLLISAFDILSGKYNLIEGGNGSYNYVLPLDEINYKEKIMGTKWFFKGYDTQLSEFLIKSEKILILEELFLVPVLRKISKGKQKGTYNHYILIDNGLKETYLYTVSDFRYLESKATLYKLLHNLYSKGRACLFIEYLRDNAPKMAHNNYNMMKLIFKGKIGNFYRSQTLIKR